MNFAKNQGKPCSTCVLKTLNFSIAFSKPEILVFRVLTEPLQTSTKHRFLFRQITFDHHWPTVILYVEDWQSSRQIDVIILKLFQKYLHTHYYLVADIRIRRYIHISIDYNTSLKKPWHTFVFPNQDMWKLNMFIVSASDS